MFDYWENKKESERELLFYLFQEEVTYTEYDWLYLYLNQYIMNTKFYILDYSGIYTHTRLKATESVITNNLGQHDQLSRSA